MGLLDKIFAPKGTRPVRDDGFFKTLTAYSPTFTSFGGQIYESELVRSAIDARARHISKLKVDFTGTANPKLKTLMRVAPNPWMTWSQFLYRTSTVLDMQNNAFIVPVYDGNDEISGYFPVLPSQCELLDVDGEPWIRYTFRSGLKSALPLAECGIANKFQYQDDIFGTDNRALNDTMNLIAMQHQGIESGIKNSASFRFLARMSNFAKPEDLAKERMRFNRENLQGESGGLLLMPNTYTDIKELKSAPYVIDSDQMRMIQQSVYSYFGVNEDVLQGKAYGDSWSAFYDSAIEPFAVQLSEVMSRMTFSDRERSTGNAVYFTANRLQYASTTEKLNVSAQLADRGIMNRDEIREIWGLPPLPNGEGQDYIIRGEYKNAKETTTEGEPIE